MANWRKTNTLGVFVAPQKHAWRPSTNRRVADASRRGEVAGNPVAGKVEWQKPVTKDRSEVLSWLGAARSAAAHLKEQAAAYRGRWVLRSRPGHDCT